MSQHLQRAELLLQQRRPSDAAAAAREAIAHEPEDPWGYCFLAHALAADDLHADALAAADQALSLDPQNPEFHRARIFPLIELKRAKEAEAAARDALALAPDSPALYNGLAWSLLKQKRWQEAFDATAEGLRDEPTHAGLTAARAFAERQLGREIDAHGTLEASLTRDPENAYTHNQLGWTWLQRKDARRAMVHFSEALRIDPTLDQARAGLVEAMKARNPVYRVFLQYQFAMSRLSSRAQWGIWIGAYVMVRIAISISNSTGTPALGLAIGGIYLLFIWSTWTLEAVFNLLLFVDPIGRHALSKDDRRGAQLSVAALAVAAICALGAIVLPGQWLLFAPAIAALSIMIPGAALFSFRKGRNRIITGAFVCLQCATLIYSINRAWVGDAEPSIGAATIVFFSAMLYTWLAALLRSRD